MLSMNHQVFNKIHFEPQPDDKEICYQVFFSYGKVSSAVAIFRHLTEAEFFIESKNNTSELYWIKAIPFTFPKE